MTEQNTTIQSTANAEAEAAHMTSLGRSSEWARAKETEGVVCQTHVGGQALIEGIMMRGKFNWAVAVREPSGDIYVEEHDLSSGKDKNSWLHKPVVRGCTALFESLMLAFKALEIASQHAFDLDDKSGGDDSKPSPQEALLQDDFSQDGLLQDGLSQDGLLQDAEIVAEDTILNPSATALAEPDKPAEPVLSKVAIAISMVIGVVLGVFLFIALPAFLTNLMVGDYAEKTLLWNVVDGVLRIIIFLFYVWLIGRMKDIKRMFGYHGAEHKAIHCYEHGLELTVENARTFPTFHVRCGTAFLLMTMLIAIFVFTITPIGPLIDFLGVTNGAARLGLVILSRIILLPVIAGLSYEITVKWAGSRPKSPFVQFVLWPGMQMQRLTTCQPDDGMLECAIVAMKSVLAREEREHAARKSGI